MMLATGQGLLNFFLLRDELWRHHGGRGHSYGTHSCRAADSVFSENPEYEAAELNRVTLDRAQGCMHD